MIDLKVKKQVFLLMMISLFAITSSAQLFKKNELSLSANINVPFQKLAKYNAMGIGVAIQYANKLHPKNLYLTVSMSIQQFSGDKVDRSLINGEPAPTLQNAQIKSFGIGLLKYYNKLGVGLQMGFSNANVRTSDVFTLVFWSIQPSICYRLNNHLESFISFHHGITGDDDYIFGNVGAKYIF